MQAKPCDEESDRGLKTVDKFTVAVYRKLRQNLLEKRGYKALVARLDKIFNEVPPENHSAALAEFLEKDFRSTVKRMMKRYPDNNPLPLRTLSLKRQKAG